MIEHPMFHKVKLTDECLVHMCNYLLIQEVKRWSGMFLRMYDKDDDEEVLYVNFQKRNHHYKSSEEWSVDFLFRCCSTVVDQFSALREVMGIEPMIRHNLIPTKTVTGVMSHYHYDLDYRLDNSSSLQPGFIAVFNSKKFAKRRWLGTVTKVYPDKLHKQFEAVEAKDTEGLVKNQAVSTRTYNTKFANLQGFIRPFEVIRP